MASSAPNWLFHLFVLVKRVISLQMIELLGRSPSQVYCLVSVFISSAVPFASDLAAKPDHFSVTE